MEKKKVLIVGCSSDNGQRICNELTTSKDFVVVAGFDTKFSMNLNYPFKTCVTIDEIKTLSIDLIINSTPVIDYEIANFEADCNIPVISIDENGTLQALEKYL